MNVDISVTKRVTGTSAGGADSNSLARWMKGRSCLNSGGGRKVMGIAKIILLLFEKQVVVIDAMHASFARKMV